MLIEPELRDDEKQFLISKWYKLKFEEIEHRIKELNIELRKLYNKQKHLENRKKYYSKCLS